MHNYPLGSFCCWWPWLLSKGFEEGCPCLPCSLGRGEELPGTEAVSLYFHSGGPAGIFLKQTADFRRRLGVVWPQVWLSLCWSPQTPASWERWAGWLKALLTSLTSTVSSAPWMGTRYWIVLEGVSRWTYGCTSFTQEMYSWKTAFKSNQKFRTLREFNI